MLRRIFFGVAFGILVVCEIGFGQSGTPTAPTTGGLGQWKLTWPPELIVPPNTQPQKPEPLEKTVTMRVEEVCKGSGPTWFRVFTTETTYGGPNTFGPTITDTQEIDTGEKCQKQGSTRPDNSPAANPKSKYPVLYRLRHPGGLSGPSPGAGGGTSGHAVGPAPIASPRPQVAANADAQAPTSFQFPLPWRALPAPPLYDPSETLPSFTISCATNLNPTAFWLDHINATVTREDMCTSHPQTTINVPTHPLQLEVTPDGSLAIVTSYDNGITFIDTTSNQIEKIIQTDPSFTPSGLAISPDGSYALVTNYEPAGLGGAAIAVVDVNSKSIVTMIPLDRDFPQSVFLNPDATLIWVTYPFENVVDVIDVMTGAIVRSLSLESPCDVAFNPTGTLAYVAGGETSGYVSMFNTQTYASLGTAKADRGACDLMVSPDELFLSVNNYLAGSITFVDLTSFSPTTISITGSPRGIALIPSQ